MKRYRNKRRNIPVTEGLEIVTDNSQSVTEGINSVTDNVTAYHPVLEYLVNPVKREKLGRIIQSLKNHNQLENVYLGCGKFCMPMDVVAGYYEATI